MASPKSEKSIFQEAFDAAKRGQRSRARELLTRLLHNSQDNPKYWLLMSSVVESDKERVHCLQSVLRLDSENRSARQGLTLLGALPPDDSLQPSKPMRRKWDVVIDETEQLTGFRKFAANPVVRLLTFSIAGVLVIGLILLGIFAPRGTIFGPRLTITPLAWTPTSTASQTPTPEFRSPTPTPATAVPLWMLLEETYTPTPVYVNTPHPLVEAYRAGMRAYYRENYQSMLDFMVQVQRAEPDKPDSHYYVGEAYRQLENYEFAIMAYDSAIETDQTFAPAYLGRAMARQALNPADDISRDLENAVKFDPQYTDAAIALAQYNIADPEKALEILQDNHSDSETSPEFYLLRAKIKLALGDHEGALQDAETSFELSSTILDTYLVLAYAYLLNGQPDDALEKLEIYGRYEDDDPTYYALLGWSYLENAEYQDAMEALNHALELDDELFIGYLIRGRLNIQIGESEDALNDLYIARSLAPYSFDAHLLFARALVADGRINDSITHFNVAEDLARLESQLAAVYYFRALAYEALGQPGNAKDDYSALLLLPAGSASRIWIISANKYLATATPTATASKTPLPTRTFTVTPSPTASQTPSLTPSLTSTPSPTHTFTPTYTLTSTATLTPSSTPTLTPSKTQTPAP